MCTEQSGSIAHRHDISLYKSQTVSSPFTAVYKLHIYLSHDLLPDFFHILNVPLQTGTTVFIEYNLKNVLLLKHMYSEKKTQNPLNRVNRVLHSISVNLLYYQTHTHTSVLAL